MASLNTLRTRGGIIISIVIGIALIAFLMGDFVPQSCSSTTVGTINGHKVGYEEYYFESEHYQLLAQTMYNRDALSLEESDVARNNAWQSLIAKYAYRPGFRKLGLSNSEAEQADMVNGQYLSPIIMGNFANPQNGLYDPAMLSTFVMQLDYDFSGRLRAVWEYMVEQMNDQRSASKFYTLVQKGMYVTDLEVEAALAATNTEYNITVAGKDYSSVPDSLVTVTMSDIKQYYNEHKGRYRQQPSREIEYVVFDLLPSNADYDEAERYITTIATEFAEAENPMQYALLNSQTPPSQMYLTENEVDGPIAAALFNNPDGMYGPELVGDSYTIARLGDVKMTPEMLGARHILLPYTERALADSLAGLIRQGEDFELLALQYSQDPSAQMNGSNLGEFNPEYMVPEFSNPLMDARVGEVIVLETGYGIHIVELTHKAPLVRRAQVATIRYKVDPSSATQQEIYAQASKFYNSASGSYDNFKKAATEEALAKRVARIRNTDRTVSGLEDSRELVRWAFENKKGQVSDVKEIGNSYVIAALTEVRSDEYAKPEDVVDQIRPIVVKQKKADLILKDLAGSTLAEAASSIGADPREVSGVSFNPFVIDGIGVEPRLIGAVSAATPNHLAKPVKGDMGIYLFQVDSVVTDDDATPESERIRIDASSEAYLDQRLEQALSEAAKIKDNRVRYF